MNLQKLVLTISLSTVAIFAATTTALAQQTDQSVAPSFDVTIQLLVGSNDSGRSDVPAELTAITKQLEKRYSITNVHLANTFQGRINNGGTYQYKSVSNALGRETPGMPQTFLEWTVQDMKARPTAKGAPGLQAEMFHFGAHVPVAVSTGDKTQFQFENIGIDSHRLGVAEDTPTMIGTLTLPGTSGTMFLVMTVRPADI